MAGIAKCCLECREVYSGELSACPKCGHDGYMAVRERQEDASSEFGLPPRATPVPTEGRRAPALRFPALRIIAVLCWIVAAVCLAAAVFGGPALASEIRESDIRAAVAVLSIAAGLLSGVFWVAMGEIIHVLLATEENTRETVSVLRSQRQ